MYAKDLPNFTVVDVKQDNGAEDGEYIKTTQNQWVQVFGEYGQLELDDKQLDGRTYRVVSLPVMRTPFTSTATPYPKQPIKELLFRREVEVAIWSEYSLVNCPHSEVLCDECRKAWI